MRFSITSQLQNELRSSIFGYPDFVFKRNPKRLDNEVPVFVFHTIEPATFESQLIFLKKNGYRTLSIDQFNKWIKNDINIDAKSILLTVDDGRSSFWRFGYPLLRKYSFKATLFIVPGSIAEADICRHNLFDAWNGQSDIQKIKYLDPDDETLCNWNEIKKMYSSGAVNIESHTLFHKEVFIGKKILDFISSDTQSLPYNSPFTAYLKPEDAGKELKHTTYYGLPIFHTAPLMSGLPALKFSKEVLSTCREYFHQINSLENNTTGWKKKLKERLINNRDFHKFSFQSNNEIQSAIREDLQMARCIIQQRLDKFAGNHLCLPYSVGSKLAIEVARKIGMKSCFWGVRPKVRINKVGQDPFHTVRIKNDFLFRLPGTARRTLLSIYSLKLQRRLKKEKIY